MRIAMHVLQMLFKTSSVAPSTISLCSFTFLILWDHGSCVVYIWKAEFRSCAWGRQLCSIFHYNCWTVSIKPRLLFSPCRLNVCFLRFFPFCSDKFILMSMFGRIHLRKHFIIISPHIVSGYFGGRGQPRDLLIDRHS